MEKEIIEQYRFDQYGSVYEYSKENNCYIFIGKLNGRTEKEFLDEYMNSCQYDN